MTGADGRVGRWSWLSQSLLVSVLFILAMFAGLAATALGSSPPSHGGRYSSTGVLDAFHSGSAEVLGVKGNDIVVRAPGVTGFNHNPRSGFPNQPTDVFFIKGSTSPSVVPYNPTWTP